MHTNKRRFILIILFLGPFLWPTTKALMSNKVMPENMIPQPPLEGRKAERKAYSYLSKTEPTYDKWIHDGRSYLARKEFEQAILAFRKALRLKPLAAEAHFFLAYSCERRGLEGLPGDMTNWEQLAEMEYRTAIKLDDYLPARYNLACLLERQQRYDEARHEFEHILTIAPKGRLAVKAATGLNRTIEAKLAPESRGYTSSYFIKE